MKRTLATTLFAVLLLAPVAGTRDIITHTLTSLVRVEFPVYEDGELTEHPGTCTGFMVEPHHALTAAHCIPEDAGFTVDGEDSFVIKQNDQFALVYAGTKPILTLTTKLKVQDVVMTFGFAWGDMFIFQRQVAVIKDGDFAMDGPLAPGMSGGPVVNGAGKVIGINQSANTVIGIACGAGEIQTFLTASPK
jgi:hypothetical protein